MAAIYEGKAKRLWTTDDPQVLRLSPALTLTPAEAPRLARALEALEVKA